MTTRHSRTSSVASILVSSVLLLLLLRPSHGFQSSSLRRPPTIGQSFSDATITTTSSSTTTTTTTTRRLALPKQNAGESDIDYIKRLTSMSDQTLASASAKNDAENDTSEEKNKNKKKKGKYVPIEEWDAQRKASGELSWEEKVQFEGQRYGNQVRQNDILNQSMKYFG